MNDRMTIILFSGNMDKAMAALILATTGASLGMDVSIFFTFWGLSFLKKKNFKKKNLLFIQKIMNLFTPKDKNSLPLSNFNMLGLGAVMMKKIMKKTKIASLDELFELAKTLNVKFFACSTSCNVMGLGKEDMIEEVSDIVGAASFLAEAKNSKVNLFI